MSGAPDFLPTTHEHSPAVTPQPDTPKTTVQSCDTGPTGSPVRPVSGRYVLGEEIARGGMGAVYRAADTVLGREVAVKILQEQFGPESAAARRFADEARITGQLQHPGIPPVHDLGMLPDGRPFLAMKLIKGSTLDLLLVARPDLADERAQFLAVFEAICQAVAYAHARGVIHRDLKPGNVMVGAFGEVQVMDWGLAKVLRPDDDAPAPAPGPATTDVRSLRDSDGQATQAGSVMGTPAYMPPEQAAGAVDLVDARSDVFALGGVLAAVLTGAPPFQGDTAEATRVKSAQGKVDDCFARLDGCGADPELVALGKRCLAPEMAARPADAGEVARAVAGFRLAAEARARQAELDRVKAQGARAMAEATAAEQRKRRRVQLVLAGAVVLLVAAGGGVAVWRVRDAAAHQTAVAALLAQADAALGAGDADRAAAFLDQVDQRTAGNAGEAFAARLAEYQRDLTMLRELDEVDAFRWTVTKSKLPTRAQVTDKWQSAFAKYQVLRGRNPAADDARRVNDSHCRAAVVTALDEWLARSQNADVLSVLLEADPDPFRSEVRRALASGDPKQLAALVDRPEFDVQPAGLARAFAGAASLPVDTRRAFLKRVVVRQGNDFGLLMSLAATYPQGQADGAADRVRWYQTAVGLGPKSSLAHDCLGLALFDNKDVPGAIAAYREAIRNNPEDAYPHEHLAQALRAHGDADGAEKAEGRAKQLREWETNQSLGRVTDPYTPSQTPERYRPGSYLPNPPGVRSSEASYSPRPTYSPPRPAPRGR